MNGIIPQGSIRMDVSQRSLWGLESILSSQRREGRRCLSGESSEMIVDNKASTAPYSEMKAKNSHRTLSERQTPLLISAGLVKGCTLTFGKRLLSQGIRGIVLFAPDGSVVDEQKAGFLF